MATADGKTSDAAADVLRRHGDHPSAFLALNSGTRHYQAAGIDGLIAYQQSGHHLLELAGPFASTADRPLLLRSFLEWAGAERRSVTAVQLRARDVQLYAEHGFVVNQLGASFAIDLEGLTLAGTRFMKTRNKISRARRLGVVISERDSAEGGDHELDKIDAEWLRGKGRFASQLEFMVGERAGLGQAMRRIFVARHHERPVAYATYSPCWDAERPGWLYDLTRRLPVAPPGTIELLFHTAALQLREEGCRWLHLGFTPFVGLDSRPDAESFASPVVSNLIRLLASRGAAVYPARTQEQFKVKWAPAVIEPEYIAFQRRPSVGAVWQLLRVTNTIDLKSIRERLR